MNWEGYSWLLLRACGVSSNQLLTILQPYQGRFPATQQEFEDMQLAIRRIARILENTPGNLAQSLRAVPRGAFSGLSQEAGPEAGSLAALAEPAAASAYPAFRELLALSVAPRVTRIRGMQARIHGAQAELSSSSQHHLMHNRRHSNNGMVVNKPPGAIQQQILKHPQTTATTRMRTQKQLS